MKPKVFILSSNRHRAEQYAEINGLAEWVLLTDMSDPAKLQGLTAAEIHALDPLLIGPGGSAMFRAVHSFRSRYPLTVKLIEAWQHRYVLEETPLPRLVRLRTWAAGVWRALWAQPPCSVSKLVAVLPQDPRYAGAPLRLGSVHLGEPYDMVLGNPPPGQLGGGFPTGHGKECHL